MYQLADCEEVAEFLEGLLQLFRKTSLSLKVKQIL